MEQDRIRVYRHHYELPHLWYAEGETGRERGREGGGGGGEGERERVSEGGDEVIASGIVANQWNRIVFGYIVIITNYLIYGMQRGRGRGRGEGGRGEEREGRGRRERSSHQASWRISGISSSLRMISFMVWNVEGEGEEGGEEGGRRVESFLSFSYFW